MKLEVDAPKESELRVKEEDPFSFDTEDKRKSSPTKTNRVVLASEGPRSVTRLPASRIVTQGKGAAAFADTTESQESNSPPTAIARPGRTYTRSSEGRMAPSYSAQLIMDQFVEVGKTVKTNSGSIEVVYSVEPHEPTATSVLPGSLQEVLSIPEKTVSPRKTYGRLSTLSVKSPLKDETSKGSSSSAIKDEEEDDDDIFPATFRRTPLKTYTGEIITPIFDLPDEPLKGKRKKGPTGAPRGRKPSRYTDPNLIEEYRKRYEETHGKREPTAGMFNSTVVSAKELRNNQGTTLVVVCKPKVDVTEKKDDVQTKYFKNVKKELDKADRNLEVAEEIMKEGLCAPDAETVTSPVSASPAPCLKKSPALTASQETDSTASTPTRLLRVHFADEESSASSKLSLPERKATARGLTARSKDDPVAASSSTSNCSQGSEEASSCSVKSSDVNSGKSDISVTSRTRSGNTRQYRIFKSRGPQPPPEEPKSEDTPTLKEPKSEVTEETPSSPPMPELTLEMPDSSDSAEDSSNPPNIIDEGNDTETTPATESSPLEMEGNDSSQASDSHPTISSESVTDRTEECMEESPSPQQGRPSDSQDTPSPASDDSSHELSQEIVSTAESSIKEDSAPVAPRRFFKSKKSSSASSLQRKVFEKSPSKASYNARSWHSHEDTGDKDGEAALPPAKQARKASEDILVQVTESSKQPKLTRSLHLPKDKDHEAYTSVKVQKQHKELYTVVHNVKMAHEVLESGETQDFMDDIEYLLENLKDDQPMSIRALSTIQLAGRCILPAFRMHLRAHGTVTKIFSLLHDACSNSCLALGTAAMMFMLSRDRLNMDLDKESLHLMLKLNEVDMPRYGEDVDGTEEEAVEDSSELQKCRSRVQEMLVQLQRETKAKQIDLGFVSTGNLAMESLLSLTSRRAGEWFKEELRQLGGLDHFVETVNHCVGNIKGDLASNLDNYTPCLKKLDRCLRVLENITFMNSDNQTYLVAYNKGLLITATGRIMQQCIDCLLVMPLVEVDDEVALKEQAGWIIFDCLLAILRVMLNITHDSEFGSTRLGEEEGMLQRVLQCVVITQWYVPPDQRFDLLVLSLGLLVNLMEHCAVNRRHLMETRLVAQLREGQEPQEMDACKALVELFIQRESAARQMEESPETPLKSISNSSSIESPNKSGEWHESDSGIQWIAKSAEKVKQADAQRREAEKQGDKEDGDKSIDGASILEDDETFTKALHKAGKHMENSIVASYAGLLLGCLIQDNRKFVDVVKSHLTDESFEPMIRILKKFLGFMSLTTAIGTTDANSLQRVIDNLEAC